MLVFGGVHSMEGLILMLRNFTTSWGRFFKKLFFQAPDANKNKRPSSTTQFHTFKSFFF